MMIYRRSRCVSWFSAFWNRVNIWSETISKIWILRFFLSNAHPKCIDFRHLIENLKLKSKECGRWPAIKWTGSAVQWRRVGLIGDCHRQKYAVNFDAATEHVWWQKKKTEIIVLCSQSGRTDHKSSSFFAYDTRERKTDRNAIKQFGGYCVATTNCTRTLRNRKK